MARMRIAQYLFLLAGALIVTACAGLLNVIVPRSGYTVYKDIAYGDNPRQQLDIYVPDDIKTPAGVILFFYGGSWQKGSKDDYRFAGQAFASRGYIAVIADYRLYPEIYFPAFMEDSAQALAWVHAHIDKYNGDPRHIFLAGHSAGAYNAVMLTLNDRYIKAAGGNRSWIKGTIGIAGPYDFLPFTDPDIKAIFSKSEDAQTQPIHFAAAHMPPMLLITGDDDDEVKPKNTIHLTEKLESLHDPVTKCIYPGVGHIGIVLSLASGFRGKAPVLDDIDTFIRSHQTAP